MNAGYMIQCFAISPRFSRGSGPIENRSCIGFGPGLAGHSGKALAYACNNNYYVNSSGTSCTRRPGTRSTRDAPRNAETAGLAAQSPIAGRVRITAALFIGTELR
jgi:hypothetical protein